MNANNQKINLKISGMACNDCEAAVEKVLMQLDGVEEVSANHKTGTATVAYLPSKVISTDFEKAIDQTGYSFKSIN